MRAKILKIMTAAGILGVAPLAVAQGQGQGQSRGQGPTLDREAVALIGYDLNNDGRADTYYWVSRWDVENLQRDQQRFQRTGQPTQRQMTERRLAPGHPGQMTRGSQEFQRRTMQSQQRQRMSQQQRSRQAMQDSQTQSRRFSGTITDLTTFRFSNDGKQHVVAKVQLRDGLTLPVHFGPRDQLDVDLSEGKRITFSGNTGRINGSRVIVADSIGNRRLSGTVQSPSDKQMRELSGTVQQTKTFEPEGKDQRHMLAKIQTPQGPAIVDLGPVNALQQRNINLSQGDRVQLLAKPGRINNNNVLLAHRVKPADRSTAVRIERQNRILSTDTNLPIRSWKSDGKD